VCFTLRFIKLVFTSDQYTKLKPGDKGTVHYIDDLGTVHIQWDNGSTLGMIIGEDIIKKL